MCQNYMPTMNVNTLWNKRPWPQQITSHLHLIGKNLGSVNAVAQSCNVSVHGNAQFIDVIQYLRVYVMC